MAKASQTGYLKETLSAYGFLSPTVILFTIFYFIPLVRTFLDSFYAFNIMSTSKTFVGMQNYQTIFANGDFRTAFWHTVVYTFFTVIFGTILSLLAAILLNLKIRGRAVYRTLYFLPVIAPTVATSIVFSNLFANDNTGVMNQILARFGIGPIAWLGDPRFAMFTVIVFGVWSLIGYNMVIFLAGLQGIPEMYYEAARLDGAGAWTVFRKITVPLLTGTTTFIVVIGVISAFQVFNQVYIMTGGGPLNATTVIVFYIYQAAFQNFNGGSASAMAVILFIVLLVLSIIQLRGMGRKPEGA